MMHASKLIAHDKSLKPCKNVNEMSNKKKLMQISSKKTRIFFIEK